MNHILKKTQHFDKISEITGISCSGKSALVGTLGERENILIFDVGQFISSVKKRTVLNRFAVEIINLLNLVMFNNGLLSLSDVFWLSKEVYKVRATFRLKLNILFNCILKFSYHATIRRKGLTGCSCIIDEGISHIPFLLQEQDGWRTMQENFFKRFERQLSQINVIYLDERGVNTIERLIFRGHKRLKNKCLEGAKAFDKKNRETMLFMVNRSNVFKSFNKINQE
jgi:hypothetical protein